MKRSLAGPVPVSSPGYGVTWGGPPRAAGRALTAFAAAAMVAGMAGPAGASAPSAGSTDRVDVIVRELPGAGDRPEKAVAFLGGAVGEPLGIIGGFTAQVPADRLASLRAVPGIFSVTENAAVTLTSTEVEDQLAEPSSLYSITHEVINADEMWNKGFTGKGVDVAVIDSGVVAVDGLRGSGKVVHGPDLSFEAQLCDGAECVSSPMRNLDTYGHGTHMAGIIAGRDDAVSEVSENDTSNFMGVAPDSRIVSVKVADAFGATDVSQVIAAIDWVVQNRAKNGLNIRVLNLSFGTDGVQDYMLDPLTYAAEQAWHSGIVVVVAAGNGGYGTGKLNNPAYDPYVIAVGGVDNQGTHRTSDDVIPEWSSTGDGGRNPDVVATGRSVIGLRAPGSYLDERYPDARTGTRFFRGNGTSQAAAVTSGAAALLVSQFPGANPDQIKAVLRDTANSLPKADPVAQGRGVVDLEEASRTGLKKASVAEQTWPRATGAGSLDAARGTSHLTFEGVTLRGEFDVRGRAWDAAAWSAGSAAGTTWSGGSLDGGVWNGGAWNGADWYETGAADGLSGITWSGITWSGITWSGITWSGITWSGAGWD